MADGVSDGTLDPARHPVLLLAATVALGTVPQILARLLADRLPLPKVPGGPNLARELASVLLRGVGAKPASAV